MGNFFPGTGAPFTLTALRMSIFRFHFFALIVLALSLTGCDLGGGAADVPAQTYMNGLAAVVERTGNLRGQIVFPSEYAQHSIRFSLNEVTFVTHPDGRFRLANVPAGEHWLGVRIKGYEPLRVAVTVPDGESVEMAPLRLRDARGKVLGRLVHEKGTSVEGVEVRLVPDDGVAVSDGDGIFQFLGVSAGEHTLMIKDARYFAGNQHFRLGSDERRNLGNIKVFRQQRGDPRTARLQD